MDPIGFCVWCRDLVHPYQYSDLTPETCERCSRQHEDSFIEAFDLTLAADYTSDLDGDVECWIGDAVACAAGMWLHVHQMIQDGDRREGTRRLETMSITDLATLTREMLAGYHGASTFDGTPFAVTTADD